MAIDNDNVSRALREDCFKAAYKSLIKDGVPVDKARKVARELVKMAVERGEELRRARARSM